MPFATTHHDLLRTLWQGFKYLTIHSVLNALFQHDDMQVDDGAPSGMNVQQSQQSQDPVVPVAIDLLSLNSSNPSTCASDVNSRVFISPRTVQGSLSGHPSQGAHPPARQGQLDISWTRFGHPRSYRAVISCWYALHFFSAAPSHDLHSCTRRDFWQDHDCLQ